LAEEGVPRDLSNGLSTREASRMLSRILAAKKAGPPRDVSISAQGAAWLELRAKQSLSPESREANKWQAKAIKRNSRARWGTKHRSK